MIETLAAVAKVLVIDLRSIRAIDETMLDWNAELDGAASRGARLWCHLRSAVALARTLALSLPREIAGGRLVQVLTRMAVVCLAPAVAWLLVTGSFSRHPADPLPLTPLDAVRLNVWWLANIVAFLLPLAWFCSAAWPARRHVSRIGLVVSAFVVSVAFSGWVGPKAAKHSYDAMWDRQERAWQAQGVTIESPRRLSSLPTLLDRVRPVGGRDHHELEVVRAYTLALPLFCSSLVLLATVLPARHRWRWIVAVSVTIAAQRLVPELLRTPGPFHLRSYFLDLLVFSYLIAIGVVSMIALLLLRRKALRALSREPWAP